MAGPSLVCDVQGCTNIAIVGCKGAWTYCIW